MKVSGTLGEIAGSQKGLFVQTKQEKKLLTAHLIKIGKQFDNETHTRTGKKWKLENKTEN